MSIQQLNNLNLKAGLEANGDVGSAGQVLSSTGPNGVEWINQSAITASSDFIYYEVKNETGSTILKGKGVMAVGTDGNSGHILVDEMVADGTITPRYFLGVLETSVDNGGFARVIAFGELDQFNTNGQNGETWSNGQVLWCDPDSPGDFTITEPNGPNVKIPAAFILKASTNGKIQVRVQANEGVKDLYDTKIDSQVDGDVLVWDNTTGVWFNNDTLSVKYSERAVAIGDFTPPISGKLQISNEATDVWSTLIQLNSTGTQSRMSINNNGTGDSQINFQLLGSSKFTLGVDNSDSDKFKISGSSTLGSNDRLVIDSSGNVGIGTTSPSDRLEVAAANSQLRLTDTDDSKFTQFSYSSGKLVVRNNSTTTTTNQFTLDAAGQMGIGTTSPTQKLHVDGNARVTGAYYDSSNVPGTSGQILSSTATGTNWISGSAIPGVPDGSGTTNYLARWTDADTLGIGATYDNGTNVGIGTTSPNYLFEVDKPTAGGVFTTIANFKAGTDADNTGAQINVGMSSRGWFVRAGRDVGNVAISTMGQNEAYGSYDYMTFKNGNVGIGTTSPDSKLQISGSGTQRLRVTSTDGANADLSCDGVSSMTLGSPNGIPIRFVTSNAERMRIQSDGNVGIGTTSPETKLDVIGGSDYQTINIGESKTDNDVKRSGITFTHYDTDQPEVTLINSYIDSNISYVSIGGSSAAQVATENIRFFTAANTTTISGTERMRINSSGNVGIGTTSPGQKLSIQPNADVSAEIGKAHIGMVGFSGYAGFSHVDRNSAGNYALLQASNGATYLNTSAGQPIRFRINNVDQMILTSGGNVGIGTTSPGKLLELSGGANVAAIRLRDTTSNVWDIQNSSLGKLDFIRGGTNTYMRIDQIGNVGIGTTSPQARTHVFNSIVQDGFIVENSSTSFVGSAIFGNNTSTTNGNLLRLRSSGSDKMVVLGNGNVGIGTTSPSYKLDVNGTIASSVSSGFPELRLSDAVSDFVISTNSGGEGVIKTEGASKNIRFFNDSGETMRISGGGNVGIGTTSPAQKLQVAGSILANGAVYSGSTTHGFVSYFGNTDIQTSSGGSVLVRNALTYRPIQASAFTVSSDYRLKSNITPLENAIDRLNQLNVHRFNWSDRLDEPKVDGFIAHEVSPIIPEAVLGEKDEVYEDGTPKHQGIDQAKIVPLLTAALQEAILKIEQLETRIQTLENN